jgi:hypothetical protein
MHEYWPQAVNNTAQLTGNIHIFILGLSALWQVFDCPVAWTVPFTPPGCCCRVNRGKTCMLTTLMILISLAFMAFLTHRWLGLTAMIQSENRQKRMTQHLDWQSPQNGPRRTRKLSR